MRLLLASAALMLPAVAYAMTRRQSIAAPGVVDWPAEPAPVAVDFIDMADRLAAPTFLQSIGVTSMGLTRGERNNNPGNIEKSGNAWQGKVVGADPRFETFSDPVSGLRAMAKLLRNYQQLYGLNTIGAIVAKWAPATENNVAAYVSSVSASTGIAPDAPLNLSDAGQLAALVTAMVRHENGRVIYSADQINQAVRSA